MNILFHKHFVKMHKRLPRRLQQQCEERIELFLREPFNPMLRNHALTGKFEGYRSINITGSVRTHFKVLAADTIIFVRVGSHPELYGE